MLIKFALNTLEHAGKLTFNRKHVNFKAFLYLGAKMHFFVANAEKVKTKYIRVLNAHYMYMYILCALNTGL